MSEWKYTDGNGHVIVVEAEDAAEAGRMLAQIVEDEWPDTTVDDWQDA